MAARKARKKAVAKAGARRSTRATTRAGGRKKATRKKALASTAEAGAGGSLPTVFDALKRILRRHGRSLDVVQDRPGNYTLQSRQPGPDGRPLWFGGAGIRKRYVSFHLFPVYCDPHLLRGISPALRRRMQGKSCFNFRVVDEPLFAELDGLTNRCVRHWRASGML